MQMKRNKYREWILAKKMKNKTNVIKVNEGEKMRELITHMITKEPRWTVF